MKQVEGQPMCMKTKANPHSHQMQVILAKKRFIVWGHFIVIEGGGGDLGQLVTIVAQPMLVILS